VRMSKVTLSFSGENTSFSNNIPLDSNLNITVNDNGKTRKYSLHFGSDGLILDAIPVEHSSGPTTILSHEWSSHPDAEDDEGVYYLDIPTENTLKSDEGPWHHVTVFPTKAEAVEFIRDNIGHCDEDGNICLITKG